MLSPKTTNSEWGKKEEPKPRVDSVHGGNIVEAISSPELMNNPECEHDWLLDPTETDFVAYKCSKEDCGEVAIYDK